MKKYDVIIIGSGIAGMSAAIYLKRNNIKTLIIENDTPGGQLNRSSIIENYPGYQSIDGPTLAYNIYNQVNNLNVEYQFDKVENVDFDKKIVILKNEKIEYEHLIIATGRSPRKLEILNDYIGKGVSYCAICDGSLYKNQDVLVVGGGNSAFEESLYLSKICKSVTILNRSSNLKADEELQSQINKTNNIKLILNEEINNVVKEENIFVINDKYKVSGIFVCIGYIPNSNIFELKKENEYIITDTNYKTSIDNVYAIGDVIKKDAYQLITASSEGVIAALDIIRNQK